MEDVIELFFKFISYYQHFDFNQIICPATATAIQKKEKHQSKTIQIMNPLNNQLITSTMDLRKKVHEVKTANLLIKVSKTTKFAENDRQQGVKVC